MTDVRIAFVRGSGSSGWHYRDVDDDRLAVFPAHLPDGRKGVNFACSPRGCTVTADNIEEFITAVRAALTKAQGGD